MNETPTAQPVSSNTTLDAVPAPVPGQIWNTADITTAFQRGKHNNFLTLIGTLMGSVSDRIPPLAPALPNLSLHVWRIPALQTNATERVDDQTPHKQDEVYCVVSGRGHIRIGLTEADATLRPVRTGDLIYVPRSVWHRFEDVVEDLVIVVFFSPNYTG